MIRSIAERRALGSTKAAAVGLCLLLGFGACKSESQHKLVSRAQFGMFYGGQVQERSELPFELDRTKQVQGIRIQFHKPLERDVRVDCELGMPVPGKKARTPKDAGTPDRIVQVGQTVARAGQPQLDITLPFKPGQPLGLWHIRVKVDSEIVIDRDFGVYDRRARERERQRADAGPLP